MSRNSVALWRKFCALLVFLPKTNMAIMLSRFTAIISSLQFIVLLKSADKCMFWVFNICAIFRFFLWADILLWTVAFCD